MDTAANAAKIVSRRVRCAAVTMIKEGIEDQYPGAAAEFYAAYRNSPKTLERELAARAV
jgi:hypothetical protein